MKTLTVDECIKRLKSSVISAEGKAILSGEDASRSFDGLPVWENRILMSIDKLDKIKGINGYTVSDRLAHLIVDSSKSDQDDDKWSESVYLAVLTECEYMSDVLGGRVTAAMNANTRRKIKGFLCAIITIAVAALICTVLHIVLGDDKFPFGEQAAELIGMFDFILGVIAFVIERFDDMKKKETQNAVKTAVDSGDVQKAVNICNSVIIKNNKVGRDMIVNYGEIVK